MFVVRAQGKRLRSHASGISASSAQVSHCEVRWKTALDPKGMQGEGCFQKLWAVVLRTLTFAGPKLGELAFFFSSFFGPNGFLGSRGQVLGV